MGQETRGDVRDLPQHAIDVTSFLNVSNLCTDPGDAGKNVQHSSAYTAPPSWCHIVVLWRSAPMSRHGQLVFRKQSRLVFPELQV